MLGLHFAIAVCTAAAPADALVLSQVLDEVRAHAPTVASGVAGVAVARTSVGVAGAREDAELTVMLEDVWDRQASEVEMADAEIRRAEADASAMLKMSEAEPRMAYGRARSTERALDALESSVLPAIRETLKASRAEYVSGQGDFLRLLETAGAALGIEGQRLELVARLGVQRFESERLVAGEKDAE